MRRFLFLSVSVLALSTSYVFASKQLVNKLVDEEASSEAIVLKLQNSRDYTLTLNEENLAESVKEAVVAFKQANDQYQDPISEADKASIKFDAQYRIRANLERLKDHPVHVGDGYYTGRNFKDRLSTTSRRNPLAYPVNGARHREEPNSFLPATYRSNFLSKALCEHLWYYATHCNRNITEKEAVTLSRYLQPLFYIVQQEVTKILEGDDNLFRCRRWVYGKDRDGIIASAKAQTAHHHLMLDKANKTKYYDVRDIEDRIVPQLVGMALDLIPLQLRELHNDGRNSFRVGKNARGAVSLIRSDVDNFPYPVFQSDRLRGLAVVGDMNIPFGYVGNPSLTNQWSRVKQFVVDDGRIALEEKRNVQKLLEPVGYLFHNALRNLRVLPAHYPERDPAIDGLRDFQHQYVTNHTLPEDALNAFYNHHVALTPFLAGLRVKSATHEAMTADLLPIGLRGDIVNIRNNLLEGLVFHDMVDRFKIFYPDVVLF